jgi:aspartate kinase
MPGVVVGVASEKEVLIFTLARAESLALPVMALLDEHRVAGKQLHLAGGQLTVVVSRENLHEEARVRAALRAQFGDAVRVADTLGAVSAIGAGINASFHNLRRGSDALALAGIVANGVATSSFRITWTINRAELDNAVRLLHRTFIEDQRTPVPDPLA